MSNPTIKNGAEAYGELKRANTYVSGGAVYPGDFVTQDATGRVAAATATEALCGVALGYASGAGVNILVADDPDQLVSVEASSNQISAQASLMLNYNILANAGDSSYKISRMQIDSSTGATTATLPLKALFIEPKDNNALGNNVRVVCAINNHQLKGGTGTAGI